MRRKKLLFSVGIMVTVFTVAILLKFSPFASISPFEFFHIDSPSDLLKSENQELQEQKITQEKLGNSVLEGFTPQEVKSSLSSLLSGEEKEKVPTFTTFFSGNIHRGDTLYDVLKGAGVSSQRIYLIARSLKLVFNPKNCKPGDNVELQKHSENGLIIFKYFPEGLDYYLVEETQSGVFLAKKEKVPADKILIGVKGEIKSSLYEAMKKEGLDNELILQFADIFSWEIDFLTIPRKGDSFQIIWERYVNSEEKVLKEGRILAAQYINAGREHAAIFYCDPEGLKGYFTPEGESLRKTFLSSPLNYRRISSYFSYRRFHPILKIYRPHLGIDYAAPTGTPVSSVGEGVITFAGWKGGFGNYVKIKHPNGYITSYGHFSRIAKGITEGRKVRQGQVIGYVGTTGLSTGPHLDFRITKNGEHLNFLKLKHPRATPLESVYLEEFNKTKDVYVYYFQVLSQTPENTLVFLRETPEEREVVSSRYSGSAPSNNFPELLFLFVERII